MKVILAGILSLIIAASSGCKNDVQIPESIPEAIEQLISAESGTSEGTGEVSKPEQSQGAGFTVNGTQLIDANGNNFIMRGINHPHAWFTSQDDTALEAIAATGANTNSIRSSKPSSRKMSRVVSS